MLQHLLNAELVEDQRVQPVGVEDRPAVDKVDAGPPANLRDACEISVLDLMAILICPVLEHDPAIDESNLTRF